MAIDPLWRLSVAKNWNGIKLGVWAENLRGFRYGLVGWEEASRWAESLGGFRYGSITR